jgi:hypothetical protein
MSMHSFKLNANGSTNLNATILIKISALPQIIKDIYADLKQAINEGSFISIPGKVINAVTTIKNEIDTIKNKLSIRGTVNIEGLDFAINQKIS